MKTTGGKILIVDDEPNIHYSFQKILEPNQEIISAHNAEDGIARLRKYKPDVVVMDVKMPGMDGLEALQKMRKIDSKVPIIIMTAFGTVNTAIKAMKYGAYEYMLKPFKIDNLKKLLNKALETSELMKRSVNYKFTSLQEEESSDLIIGSSESMQQVYKLIGQVARQNVPVLILGESGTGKELVARAIYHHSKRKNKAFLCINCAALPETLLESELFGYEKGAFTGAAERRIGKFEQVDSGTMLLDEIGEMSLQTQAKILRVIQTGEITRLSGSEVIQTDVRLITATNKNLEEAIQKGKFREDLYYRLNVITISLPPLRERKEDIPELVNYFLQNYNSESNKSLKGIDKQALKTLKDYSWPGNVRQLENCIRRAAVLTKSEIITKQDLQLEAPNIRVQSQTEEQDEKALDKILDNIVNGSNEIKLLPKVEKILITKALQKCKGNQVKTAKLLGINRNTLRSRMEKHNISL